MPEVPPSSLLSPAQRRTVAAALTILAVLGAAAALLLTIVGLGRILAFLAPVLWPLATAGILALILRPLVLFLERRLGLPRLRAVLLLYAGTALACGLALALVLPAVLRQLAELIEALPGLWRSATDFVATRYPEWRALMEHYLSLPQVRPIADSLSEEGKNLLGHLLPSLQSAFGGARSVFAFFTHLAIIPVYLFLFLLASPPERAVWERQLSFLSPGLSADLVFLGHEFVTIIESFFRGQILIGLGMGVIGAVGFSLIGLKFGLVIGLAVGLLNIVPYLGSIIGLGVALPLAFFQPGGGWALVGLVLLVKALVQAAEAWILTPRILGHQTGLHPLAIIVAVFFWGTVLDGILGMLLAVPLTAFVVTAWRLVKHKYLPDASA